MDKSMRHLIVKLSIVISFLFYFLDSTFALSEVSLLDELTRAQHQPYREALTLLGQRLDEQKKPLQVSSGLLEKLRLATAAPIQELSLQEIGDLFLYLEENQKELTAI